MARNDDYRDMLKKLGADTYAHNFDMEAHYSVNGYGGIAFYALGYAKTWTEESWEYSGEGDEDDESSYLYSEPEEVEDRSRVRLVMVGDDRVHEVDIEDCEIIEEDSFCRDCGQIGCGHNVYA